MSCIAGGVLDYRASYDACDDGAVAMVVWFP